MQVLQADSYFLIALWNADFMVVVVHDFANDNFPWGGNLEIVGAHFGHGIGSGRVAILSELSQRQRKQTKYTNRRSECESGHDAKVLVIQLVST